VKQYTPSVERVKFWIQPMEELRSLFPGTKFVTHVRCSIKIVINRRFPTGRSSVDGRGDCHDYSPDIR